jgi:hypothetical protein
MKTASGRNANQFELMNYNGDLIQLMSYELVDTRVEVGSLGSLSSFYGGAEYFIAFQKILTREFVKKLIGIKGYRINEVQSGLIFRDDKRNKGAFEEIINTFLSDFPNFSN